MTEPFTLTDFSHSELFRRKPAMFFSLFTILTCIFCGLFFSRCLTDADRDALISPICDMICSGTCSVLPGLLVNLLCLGLIFISGLSLYGFPVILLVLSAKGTAMGFCTGLIYGSEADSLMLPFIISCLLIIIAFICASFTALNYALLNISLRGTQRSFRREFIAAVIISAIILAAASAAEAIMIQLP